ncbi:DUF7260 family protein [Natronorubrum sp. DTA7]|uniref:DUF7260 family protein n=1 Tax=Natronorubrum sp. DTA7 TaxID=3447016 RepID=UPI003F82CE93
MEPTAPTETLEAATRALEREQRELSRERRALERFAKRVAAFETAVPRVSNSARRIGDETPPGLTSVRKAYAETVMSVPHYTKRYDDTWLESVAEEFSDELAAALAHHEVLSLQLKRSLLAATRQSVANRTQLLSSIETECESVAAAERTCSALLEELTALRNQPLERLEFNALWLTRERLEGLRERCDELADERQREIRRERRFSLAEVGSLEQYLYQECERTYPILAAIATLGAAIARVLETVDRSLEAVVIDDTGRCSGDVRRRESDANPVVP